MQQERLTYLLTQYGNNNATPVEIEELYRFIQENEHSDLFDATVADLLDKYQPDQNRPRLFPPSVIARKAYLVDKAEDYGNIPRIVHHAHFLRKWWWAAAAALLICGTGAYLWMNQGKKSQTSHIVAAVSDVAPGGNKAILTLANGKTIVLDSAVNGSLTRQGNADVVKLDDGQLAYRAVANGQEHVVMNTMSTPPGGQYQLTLPDGTHVWLNAASSITFPTAFTGNKRIIAITGEVFLDVTRNKEKPFVVNMAGQNSIEVLGTQFNVNSYSSEPSIKTTLVEGSVKIIARKNQVVLLPGQQALIPSRSSGGQLKVVNHADIDQTLAWKNGSFNFRNMNFEEVARQLERWYNIQVVYEGMVPDIQFKGDMDRDVRLSEILHILKTWGINARIENRKLIIE